MSQVKDILARKGLAVATVVPEATALEAARIMREWNIGSLMVLDETDVIGIVTERDIVSRVVAREYDHSRIRVRQIMSSGLTTCTPDTGVEDCRQLMTSHHIRRLPVLVQGRLAGIVTAGDLMKQEMVDRNAPASQ